MTPVDPIGEPSAASLDGSPTASLAGLARVSVAPANHDARLVARAVTLGQSLGLACLAPEAWPHADADAVLLVDVDRLRLCDIAGRRPVCVDVDFVGGRTGFRRHSRPSVRQPLARAVGRARGLRDVFDATAGLARDAFLLACVGCRVTGVERSAVLVALVEDGLARARQRTDPTLAEIVERMSIVHDDAREVLAGLSENERPETVYIDPMYPASGKSALPQKDMRLCRKLVGDDVDAAELFEVARRVALRRVVVKRSPHAPSLCEKPNIAFSGRKVRYDVYLVGDGDTRAQSKT